MLLEPDLGIAVEGVHDLHLGTVLADRAQQPRDRGVRLFAQAETDPGVRGVGEVAHPGVAVVPVLAAARVLGQRRRRRGRDRTGRAEQQELQGEGAALDVVGPGSVVREFVRPHLPAADGAIDAAVDVLRVGDAQGLPLGGRDHEEVPRPFSA